MPDLLATPLKALGLMLLFAACSLVALVPAIRWAQNAVAVSNDGSDAVALDYDLSLDGAPSGSGTAAAGGGVSAAASALALDPQRWRVDWARAMREEALLQVAPPLKASLLGIIARGGNRLALIQLEPHGLVELGQGDQQHGVEIVEVGDRWVSVMWYGESQRLELAQ